MADADLRARAADDPGASDGRAIDDRRFRRGVAVAAAVGLVVRLAYTRAVRWDEGLHPDALAYLSRARFLLGGQGFVDPEAWHLRAVRSEGAIHPPGQALFLALGDLLGLESPRSFMVLGILAGTITVAVIGYLGREVIDERTGLIAAGIAAVYPGLWSHDPAGTAETLAQLLVAVLLLAVYRFWRAPSPSRAAWLGALAAAGALTRPELIVLVPLLVVPVTLASRGTNRQALTCTGSALLWCTLVLSPWVGWNLTRFEHPVALATGLDVAVADATCEEVWYGDEVGLWSPSCAADLTDDPANDLADQSALGIRYREQAGAYVRDHLDRLPVVVSARAARTVGLYAPGQQVTFESARGGRGAPVLWASMIGSWVLGALGAVALLWPAPRSRRGLAVLLAPMAAGLAGAAVTFGSTRFRSVGEVGVVVLAAAGIGVFGRLRAAREAAREHDAAAAWEEEPLWISSSGTDGPSVTSRDRARPDPDDEWEGAAPLGSTAWSLRLDEEEPVGADDDATTVASDDEGTGVETGAETGEVADDPDAAAAIPPEDSATAEPAPVGPTRRGLVIAQIAIVAVAIVAVLAVVAFRDDGSSPDGGDQSVALGGQADGTASDGANSNGAAQQPADWPAELNGRPAALGAPGTPPESVPPDAPPGTYIWTDFEGWHLWFVPSDSGSGLTGTIDADDEFLDATPVSEADIRAEVAGNQIDLELPGDQGVVGIGFNAGFFTERVTFDLQSPDGPVEPASVRLGATGSPVASLPLELTKGGG